MEKTKVHERRSGKISDGEGSQLVELAVILPLLMVIIVGIFDFSGAFNLKQKLSNAAFQGARLGASEPTTDLTQGAPTTVTAIRDVVDIHLKRAGISDCGLGTISATGSPLTWAATGTCPGGSTFTLTIYRGYIFQSTVKSVVTNVVATKVIISYPYQWQFNRVIQLLAAGPSYTPTQLQTSAIVANLD